MIIRVFSVSSASHVSTGHRVKRLIRQPVFLPTPFLVKGGYAMHHQKFGHLFVCCIRKFRQISCSYCKVMECKQLLLYTDFFGDSYAKCIYITNIQEFTPYIL